MRIPRKFRIALLTKTLAISLIVLGFQPSATAQEIGNIPRQRTGTPQLKLPSMTQTLSSEKVEKSFTKRADGAFHYQSTEGKTSLAVSMGPKEKKVEDYDPIEKNMSEYWVKLIAHEESIFLKTFYSREESEESKGDTAEFQGIYEVTFQEGNMADWKADKRVVLRMKQSDYERYLADSTAYLTQPGMVAFLEAKAKKEFVDSFNKALAKKPDALLSSGADASKIDLLKEKIAQVTVKATLSLEESPSTFTVEGDTFRWFTEKQELKRLFDISMPKPGN